MSCNSCAKAFSLLRKEKGCPGCGFSYCSKCLDHKMFVPKLNGEAKVCGKCKKVSLDKAEQKSVEPPDAYYKRLDLKKNESTDKPVTSTAGDTNIDQEIAGRLQKLKSDTKPQTTEEKISQKLKNIKGNIPQTSDAELQERLARLRGVPVATVQTQPVIIKPDLRTEQEQADDLLKQYLEQTNMDKTYKDEFNALVGDMESRLGKIRGAESTSGQASKPAEIESEDEEETVRKIVEKVKKEAELESDELPPPTNDELPFCEICNEDAKMRCLGCRYLFCKRCFNDHKDDDDGCDRYEPYTPPKGIQY